MGEAQEKGEGASQCARAGVPPPGVCGWLSPSEGSGNGGEGGAGRAPPRAHWPRPSRRLALLGGRRRASACASGRRPDRWLASAGRFPQGGFPQPAGGAGGAASGRTRAGAGRSGDDGRRQARPPGGNMPSESFCLAAQSRLDSKWLKTDIQLAFTRDGLCGLWNEMVKDGEIVYTGTELTQDQELPSRKDDGADTQNGTKKEDLTDKEKKEEEEMPAPVYKVKSILESWVWGKQPGYLFLLSCLQCLRFYLSSTLLVLLVTVLRRT
ncbi:uncharacterized protein LOC130868881 [Chionomys nivalis]|uniref:uncharacterized protein LOC130868881 n=1 Tax=Chionomys nivalis TaxID=269649 RepID=UPI0025951599|nr:uncharacterized protein LOC130868881 [Chionomys nivalis]